MVKCKSLNTDEVNSTENVRKYYSFIHSIQLAKEILSSRGDNAEVNSTENVRKYYSFTHSIQLAKEILSSRGDNVEVNSTENIINLSTVFN